MELIVGIVERLRNGGQAGLAATAERMLKALELVAQASKANRGCTPVYVLDEQDMREVRAAIAKALGEAA